MEPESYIADRTREEVYEKIDNGPTSRSYNDNHEGSNCMQTQTVSDSTQTNDYDTVEAATGGSPGGTSFVRSGQYSHPGERIFYCSNKGDFFSNLISKMLPIGRKNVGGSARPGVSTQTEESPISIQGFELCWKIIQELGLETPVSSSARDEVFESLCACVCELLDRHSILFNGLIRRFEVSDYKVFEFVANELFEANSGTDFCITWGRVVSLFAFAVRLAQKYKESQDDARIDTVVHYLSTYIASHLLHFVEDGGGWEGLVDQFPLPDTAEKQIKRTLVWSGFCVGLVATMYIIRSNFA